MTNPLEGHIAASQLVPRHHPDMAVESRNNRRQSSCSCVKSTIKLLLRNAHCRVAVLVDDMNKDRKHELSTRVSLARFIPAFRTIQAPMSCPSISQTLMLLFVHGNSETT